MECPECERDFEVPQDKVHMVELPQVVGRDDVSLAIDCPHCWCPLEVLYPDSWAEVESAWLGEPGAWPRPKKEGRS
jgi:hypothetical protein